MGFDLSSMFPQHVKFVQGLSITAEPQKWWATLAETQSGCSIVPVVSCSPLALTRLHILALQSKDHITLKAYRQNDFA